MNAGIRLTATKFLTSCDWDAADWIATTFRWHPTSGAPPIMGLVFHKAQEIQNLFAGWLSEHGNQDPNEELRISIVEDNHLDGPCGYSVHICINPQATLSSLSVEAAPTDISEMVRFGRVNRMYPTHSSRDLLPRFKHEYAKHQEFLLAPVTRRGSELWIDVELGIVKRTIHFRRLSEIAVNDIDAVALELPGRITPPD